MIYLSKKINNVSFINTYRIWANYFVIAVLLNFIFFRVFIIDNESVFYLLSFILNYAILITFFLLLFYKFYNCMFDSQISYSIIGLVFLITGTLKLYITHINTYNIIELLFFISTLVLTIYILVPIIIKKDIYEITRGVYIFILLTLVSSNLNYIIISINKLLDFDFLHYFSSYLSIYLSKVSSISFIMLMTAYIVVFMNEIIIKNINKSSALLMLIVISSATFLFRESFLFFTISLYNALNIGIYLPIYIYMIIIILFLIAMFSSFTASLFLKKYYPELIAFSLLIMAGLDMNNFSLRLISMFSIMELANLINNNETE
ncbi:WESB_1763 family membrane protein [Brachyspira sp. SAP_772]|uniref:WESB_1763 family membrane protein n=1 Tax=Brachyspira sp. SAP_772 TaxID=2608385 RepID=UPI0012F5025E|nr:WESB_1763 family membrane protein [Brachyspira sp. SAP_772]